jgi:hypothetical protein
MKIIKTQHQLTKDLIAMAQKLTPEQKAEWRDELIRWANRKA